MVADCVDHGVGEFTFHKVLSLLSHLVVEFTLQLLE